jgi:hypothetical protein
MLETISKRSNKPATRILASGMTVLLAVVMATTLHSQSAAQDQMGNAMKVPHTAQEHHEMAELYQKKAAEYRADIEAHKVMLAEYKKGVAVNPKDPSGNPYIKAEKLHCEKYIKAAEALEAEAEESARFHILRAKEMEGK